MTRAERAAPEAPDGRSAVTDFEAAVVAVLSATEPGDVLSYGEVAAEAGYPGAARAVGNLLATRDGLPWWRVVTASGRLTPRAADRQARLLGEEGVATRDGRIVAPSHDPSDGVGCS